MLRVACARSHACMNAHTHVSARVIFSLAMPRDVTKSTNATINWWGMAG